MDGRCSDECKFAAVPTGGSVSSGYVFAMNEDLLLLQSESNLMILAMLDARLVAPHHVCYFISVQTSHHRQIPMAHLLNIHIDSCCICKQLHLSTIVFVSAGNCINISAHSPGRAAVTNLHLSW